MKTQTEVRNSFWQYLSEFNPELARKRCSHKRQNEYPSDIRSMFCVYVDILQRDGVITDKLASKVTL